MKKLISIVIGIVSGAALYAQQMPLSENYFLDKYSLAPSYAGNFSTKYLFLGYRSDWSGIDGGPKTLRLSYNDSYKQNMGYGAKFIYDKAGIFKQTILLGTYSYKARLTEEQSILFGLSAGFYSSTLNISEYYNDPKYNLDPALLSANLTSKLKFMSDFSAVYTYRKLEAGLTFSNINFSDARYQDANVHYKPLSNFQVHAGYAFGISNNWDVSPMMILRGGKYIKSQFEFSTQASYQKRIWGSLMFRDPGIWGIGMGANISRGMKLGYNFNLATSASTRYFNNHEICLGINIFELTKSKSEDNMLKSGQLPGAE